ncbi:MAG TPA: YraN family protein [Propionibacteriaceae bacterium]|nr:YraN family protein [Propionibacteriaceae bacterium]
MDDAVRIQNSPQQVGALGEDLAVAELKRQGLEVLARNWRCPIGELDVVAVEDVGGRRTLVFCEVKTRTGLGFGSPLESITTAKLRRLRYLAAQWLVTEGTHADAIRIDAVGVVMLRDEPPRLTHVRGIG